MVPGRVAEGRPRFTPGDAADLARSLFGVGGTVEELPSDRDQNFRIRPGRGDPRPDAPGAASDPPAYVLKISSSNEDPEVLDLQGRALEHVARRDPDLRLQRLVPSVDGRETETVRGAGGREHRVRLVTWLPGRPLADVRPRLPRLLDEVGTFLGRLDRALADFEHPAAGRTFHWDPARGGETVEERLEAVGHEGRRALLERHLERFRGRAGPLLDGLPTGVVHGDANDHNLLVRVGGPREVRDAVRVAGLIDFGDIMRTWTVAEPAVAAAYAVLGGPDPIGPAVHLARGYHRERPLGEPELEAFFPLLALRLCISVAVASEQKRREPDNPYLTVSEAPAWRMLEVLDRTSFDEAHYALRLACGEAPCPRTAAVVAWLEANGEGAAPVIEPDPRNAETLLFDFSVGSPEHAGRAPDAGPEEWSRALFGRMAREGAEVGLGRWGEARWWYTDARFLGAPGGTRSHAPDAAAGAATVSPQSADLPPVAPDPRTVHLGADLFVPAGSPVRAPLAGRIHSLADNAGSQDYGPTLILEHASDGVRFHTLYGHLAPDVLERWEPGDAVERGQWIAAVGGPPDNGGWAPHLHFQIIVDLMGRSGDFPGVARPSERELWTGLCPDPNLLLRIPGLEPAGPGPDAADLLPSRRRHLGPNLSLSYSEPLTIVRGWMQHLYDPAGRPYLDGRNNVPHVGHAHPRVAEAAARQEAVLNTNTRYLHPSLAEYVERLLERFPEPLSVCYLVCTGSEANELALRMARARTGTKETIVVDGAYHGNTNALVEISPYKYKGKGGAGPPEWVHEVPMPDPYRGLHRSDGSGPGDEGGGDGRAVGRRYAGHVERAVEGLAAEGRGPATFIAEPLMGCGGQIVPPPGFLEGAYRSVREADGVTIADEVQVGFGRVGTHFWAFEAQGVVPDIVTLGKPMGNGHPVAGVVTTPEVAAAFDTGMEYFNTFGGSPVSCRVGMAVLDVLEDEGLQERARTVGDRLKTGLRGLSGRHPVVGDVRGSGLFLGAELVEDPQTRTPATAHARYVAERLLDHRILLSTDGPDDNVLKIKPPLQFTAEDADRLVETLDAVLAEDPVRID